MVKKIKKSGIEADEHFLRQTKKTPAKVITIPQTLVVDLFKCDAPNSHNSLFDLSSF